MDDNIIISMILHGCELARMLEDSLQSIMNQPSLISESCAEIIRAFKSVQEKLNDNNYHHTLPFSHNLINQKMGRYQSTMESQRHHQYEDLTGKTMISSLCEHNHVTCDGIMGAEGVSDAIWGSKKFLTVQSSGSSKSGPSSMGTKRTREKDIRRTVRIAALIKGNSYILPEDGFTWRKYGQKEILGSRFPRAYFGCTHHKLYDCPAKKRVQRLEDDPNTFEINYINEHTCHMSAKAPDTSLSMAPDTLTTAASTIENSFVPCIQQQYSAQTNYVGTLLSTLKTNQFKDPREHLHDWLYGSEAGGYNYQPVMDMVDVMFNSESNGDTSLDQIFSPVVERKWD